MRPSEKLVEDLVDAILDGRPIDWAAAESGADEAARLIVGQLQVLAAVVEVHRVPPVTSTPSRVAPSVPGLSAAAASEQWGHLQLLEKIGCGAFGEVFRAWDTRLDREVALKLLPAGRSSSDHEVSSIIDEGRLLARVRHPNVVTIHGAQLIGEQIGLWMEFVRGHTIEQLLEHGTVFSPRQTVDIGLQLCRAVSAVHGAGLLHRDIKAHNVMRADDGRIVLMDFGTGRELAADASSDLSGTPLYLAPEVLNGQPATVRSDIYSLGVFLFHLVTGSYPVRARTVPEIRRAHARAERTAVRTVRRDLPSKLARTIERAIDPNPDRRHPSADAVAAELARFNPRARLRNMVGIGTAVLVVAGIVGLWLSLRMPEAPVIAVLPFENLSQEPDSEYFADGLTDEIIRNLSVIDGLAVRSRTSSFSFKDKPRNTRDVGRLLDANLVVEGSVLREGGRLRINAQLVRVADDVPLWSGRFDRELKDIFGIQDEISRSIVNELRLKLGRGQRRYDTNPQAYDLYLKARTLIDRRGVPNAQKAADLFGEVIAKDAAFAPAHAGLANAYAFMSLPSGGVPFDTAHSIMRPAAVRALQLDPLLAEAHAAMGWVYSRERDWANAEKAFQQAIALNPSLTGSYSSYSISTLQPLRKCDEALRLLHTALRNDPLSLDVQREIGEVQLFAGRYDEAISTLERVRAVDPDFPFVNMFLGRALMWAGRLDEAVAMLQQGDRRNSNLADAESNRETREGGGRGPWLAHAYVMTGRRAEAEKLLAWHERSPYRLAIVYAALGDKDRTFEVLDRMAVVEPQRVGRLLISPEMALLRGDPRLAAFRKRFGLP